MNEWRQRISSFQSRLAQTEDPMRRKIIDNNLYWISNPNDVIRMKTRKTYEGDNISWIIDSCDVLHCVFPPLSDVPYRKIEVDPETKVWQLTSLIGAFEDDMQQKAYTINVPFEFKIDVDDLLFRIMLDPAQKFNIIIPLQVTELLGTFGGMMIIMNKVKCTIPTDTFPVEIVKTLQEMTERRKRILY